MEPLQNMEKFYNFKELCCAILRHDISEAWRQLETQSQFLFHDGAASIQAMRIFLTSMNRSLYDYFLFTLDLSFHECCYQNSILMHSCKNREQFYETSRKILEHYSAQLDTPERSCHVKRAKEYIENNLSEELSLPHVAAHIHISPGHLSELFTACTGKTFSTYVKERRLEQARRLLLTTEFTVQEIGQACGFASSAYFSTVFTKWAGMPPRKYRSLKENAQPYPS